MAVSQGASPDKIPPQNLEAECSVLGAMMIDKEAIGKVIEILDETCFYKESHRKIFSVIINLFEKNEAVDFITITDELRKKNWFDEVGGAVYITNLIDSLPTSANVEYYARIVKEKAIIRSMISVSTQIISNAYGEVEDMDVLVDKAEQMIFQISQRRIEKRFISMKDIIYGSMELVQNLYDHKTQVTGVASGLTEVDKLTTGFQPGELIVIAARPAMGKSAFCGTIAQNVAIRQKVPVAIFSLEMSAQQLALRMLCSEARVDSQRIRTGYLFETDWPKLTIAAGLLDEAPIFIDDSASLTPLEIRAKARRLMTSEKKLGLIIVDYLQMMHVRGRVENRQQEISEISRSLKACAKELNVPVILVSQLSRAPESRRGEDKKPQLSDLRESGAIEQDADVVIFIYREMYYNKETENKKVADVIIAKQRNGPTGDVKVTFLDEYTRFENLAGRVE